MFPVSITESKQGSHSSVKDSVTAYCLQAYIIFHLI